jgi:hypothetical protein
MKKVHIFIHVFFPLLIGGAIYFLFRNRDQYFFKWLHLKQTDQYYELPAFVKYNLVDGLWLYSLLKMIELVWKENSKTHMFIWFGIATVFSVITEVLQGWNIISGTFDTADVLMYFLVLLICLYQNTFSLTLTSKTNLQ